jgi:three-Cys-motif partner protein
MNTSPYADREQTEVKHKTLGRYLSAAVPIVGSWARDIAYIDCLAGPWNEVSEKLEDTSFHVAISTLLRAKEKLADRGKQPTMRCLLIEKDPTAFAKLSAYCRGVAQVEVSPQNWNFLECVGDIVSYVQERRDCFPFVFIDPTGWELAAVPLIQPLLRLNPGEVLINLMTSWIRRFLADEN